MKKRDLIKAIITETVQRNLAEMPQIRRFYTLVDGWEDKVGDIQGLKKSSTYDNIIGKINNLRDPQHFSANDISVAFGFKNPRYANGFIKILLQNGIIVPVEGAKTTQQVDDESDDEWTFDLDSSSDLSQEIDIASTLRNISLDKKYRILTFEWKKGGPLAVHQYLAPIFRFQTTRYRFLKPFLEGGYYKNIPSKEIVKLIQPNRWNDPTVEVDKLFPTQEAFYEFIEDNPSVVKSGKWSIVPPPGEAEKIIIKARKG